MLMIAIWFNLEREHKVIHVSNHLSDQHYLYNTIFLTFLLIQFLFFYNFIISYIVREIYFTMVVAVSLFKI